jgi:hypothetical protein
MRSGRTGQQWRLRDLNKIQPLKGSVGNLGCLSQNQNPDFFDSRIQYGISDHGPRIPAQEKLKRGGGKFLVS